jgi:tRNA(Ile)-lysidine synthase
MTTKSGAKGLLSRLQSFCRSRELLCRGDRVLAAVSGGPDSVCLAHFLSLLARRRRIFLAIAHFQHGLRREGAGDAAFVRELGRELGAGVWERSLPVAAAAAAEGRSIEDAGRVLRYRALAEMAGQGGFNKIALGHQQDDQAETFFLHLLRGTRARGLAGMPAKRPASGAPGTEIIRPLLGISRAEVLEYLEAHGLGHRTDKSNREERFTRNWVRRRVLPLLERRNPRIRGHIAALAEDVGRLYSHAREKHANAVYDPDQPGV